MWIASDVNVKITAIKPLCLPNKAALAGVSAIGFFSFTLVALGEIPELARPVSVEI
jgi:hypothetical protein